MEEKIYFAELFAIYKNFLTEKQRGIFDMHCNLDFSLSEIAEEENTTRQNVSDTIRCVKDRLLEFEKHLNVKEKSEKIIALLLDNSIDMELINNIKTIING